MRASILSAALAAALALPVQPALAAGAVRGWVAGRVVDSTGKAVPGSTVNRLELSRDGRYEATVPMGESRLVFEGKGFAPVVIVVHATERGTSGRRLVLPDVVLGPGVDLIGEVVDARTGAPVMAANAVLAGPSDLAKFATSLPERLSDKAGTGYGGAYLVRRAARGDALLVVTHPDYLPETVAVKTSEPLPTVRLQRGGVIRGVARSASGAPLANASVVAVSTGAGDAQEVRADADGTFRIDRLRPGAYTVVATGATGAAAVAEQVKVEDGETTPVELSDATRVASR